MIQTLNGDKCDDLLNHFSKAYFLAIVSLYALWDIHKSKGSFTHKDPSSGSLENSVFSSETRLVMLTSEPNPRLLPICA